MRETFTMYLQICSIPTEIVGREFFCKKIEISKLETITTSNGLEATVESGAVYTRCVI